MSPRVHFKQEQIVAFCRKWGVEEFSVFGSVLRDDFRPDSDVDILIGLPENSGLSLYDWTDMQGELASMFGRKVDLVSKRGLRNPFRRHEILTTREVLYAA
jgi:predicted nucleotidyltransferase